MKRLLFLVIFILIGVFILTGCSPEDIAQLIPGSSAESAEVREIESAYLNDAGELILRYSDGSSQNVGRVVGEDGKDGADGKNGKDGADGRDGEKGERGDIGADGSDGAVIIDSSLTDITYAASKGLRSAVSVYAGFRAANGKDYSAVGAGVIYSLDKAAGDAYVITNYHVVYNSIGVTDIGNDNISDNIRVYLYGNEYSDNRIPATYIGGSRYYDIAILKISGSPVLTDSDAAAVDFADSNQAILGESVIAIGNPEGETLSVNGGIISLDSTEIMLTPADDKSAVEIRVMRMDCAVNHGNSGGGLFNRRGELIGIVCARSADSDVIGFGYAVPSAAVSEIAKNVICYYENGYTVTDLKKASLGADFEIESSKGVYSSQDGIIRVVERVVVSQIEAGGAAYSAGLRVGDEILSITVGDTKTEITRSFMPGDILLGAVIGDTVTLEYLRDGNTCTAVITISADMISVY